MRLSSPTANQDREYFWVSASHHIFTIGFGTLWPNLVHSWWIVPSVRLPSEFSIWLDAHTFQQSLKCYYKVDCIFWSAMLNSRTKHDGRQTKSKRNGFLFRSLFLVLFGCYAPFLINDSRIFISSCEILRKLNGKLTQMEKIPCEQFKSTLFICNPKFYSAIGKQRLVFVCHFAKIMRTVQSVCWML